MNRAAAGTGRLVLIGGEPGIGKSRLADELAGQAREAGHVVLWGRGWEDAGAPPYWPWVQILRSYIRGSDVEAVRRQLGSGAEDVVQMLPELPEYIAGLEPRPATESDTARFQLFDSTTTFLRNAASARPILAVIDDLHAADTPSILFLRFVASQLGDMHLLVVGTYRDVALTPEHPLTTALVDLTREPITRLLTLPGLDLGSLSDFIGAETGLVPDPRAVAAVWRETKGNPLFVREAVRLLSAEGRLDAAAELPSLRIEVPAGVREVIARRIGHLTDTATRALALGAALGPEFSLDLLRAVDEDPVDDVMGAVDDAVAAGLLLAVSGAPGRYRFSHDLVRETLYDDLSPGTRVRLHRQIADVLEEHYASSLEAHLPELAFHYYEAARGDAAVVAKAIDYAAQAGQRASRALAYEEGARHFRMALALLDLVEAPSEEQRVDLLLYLGDVQARAGDSGSRETFLHAEDLARRSGTPQQLARAALGIGGRLPWARPGNDTRLIPALQDALALLGDADHRLRIRLLSRLACAYRSSPDKRDQSNALSRQAVDLARQLDDPATLSYAMAARYWATWWPENTPDRLPLAEEMVEVATAGGDAERIIDAELMLYIAYSEIGRMSEARRKLRDVIRVANDVRALTPWQRWLGLAPVSALALLDGDYDRAAELLEREAASELPSTTNRDDVSAWRMQNFLLAREQARVGGVEGLVRAAVEEFPWYPCHRAALVLLLIDLQRLDEARAVYADLAVDEFQAIYRDCEWLFGMALASEACALLDAREEAAVLYEQLAPFSGSHAIAHTEGSMGATDRYLGLLAETLGREEDAVTHFEAGMDLNERMGALPWIAHTQVDLARVLRARGQRGDDRRADRLERDAQATARALGMTALARQISEELGDVPAVDGDMPRDASEAVFQRDGDVWAIGRDRVFRLRDSKGLRYLATLVAHPGREFHVLELVSGRTSSPAPQASGPNASELGLRPAGGGGGSDEILDAEAKAAYRARLQELQAEVDEADTSADPVRADRARAEIDALTAELSRAFGLGGRARPEGSAAERARQSVAKAVRDALNRIQAQDASIGDHLNRSVRTGLYCAYDPDPSAEVQWRTDAARM
jgi:hypothetical protein